MSKSLWMVRAGAGGELVEDFVSGGYVAIGFGSSEFTTLPEKPTREAVVSAFRAAHPEWKDGKVINAAGQCFRFLDELTVDDEVMTFDPDRRVYVLGTIVTAPERVTGTDVRLPIRRKVKWESEVLRDSLDVDTRNTLGAIQTLFRVGDEAAADVRQHATAIGAVATAKGTAPQPKPKESTEGTDTTSLDDLRRS